MLRKEAVIVKMSLRICYGSSLCAAAVMLTACGSPAPVVPVGSFDAPAQATARFPRLSWMDPTATSKTLLYVSNGDGVVNVYTYAKRKLVGELINFKQPKGECTDGKGDVYITDSADVKIVEYAHGAKTPIRTIKAGVTRPYACAINPKNGDLAVANASGYTSYSQGNVAVYAHAKGEPTYYTNPNMPSVNGCAYDKYGDLLATSSYSTSSYPYENVDFAYLPAKSHDYQLIDLISSYFGLSVFGVGWDGKYFTVDVQDKLYLFAINIKAQPEGTISMPGAFGPVAFNNTGPAKRATQAVSGSGFYSSSNAHAVHYWNYPAGGSPIETITHGVYKPFGVAISFAK
jgi:hypothetical protein